MMTPNISKLPKLFQAAAGIATVAGFAGLGLASGWCFAADSGAVGAGDIVDGAWQHHKVKFDYVGFTSSFNCEGLESHVRQILLSIGARKDAKVSVTGCIGPNTPTHSAFVTADFYSVAAGPAPEAGDAVKVHWAPLEITPRRPDFMSDGDCELVQGMKDMILQNFSLRGVQYRTDCVPHQITLNGFKVTGDSLRALSTNGS
jgi:hypothetical protein